MTYFSKKIRTQSPLVSVSLVQILTWVYRQQRADQVTGRALLTPGQVVDFLPKDVEPHGQSACGCATIQETALLGALIRGTAGQQSYCLHPDAETIHDAVVQLSKTTHWMGAALILRYGKVGDIPDWGALQDVMFEPVWETPTSRKPVQNRWDEVSEIQGRIHKHLYCPVQMYPSREWIDLSRSEYTVWYQALQALYANLQEVRLRHHCITTLGASPQPWTEMQEYAETE